MRRKSNYERELLTRKSQTNHFSLEEEMSLQSLEYPTNVHTYFNERILANQNEND